MKVFFLPLLTLLVLSAAAQRPDYWQQEVNYTMSVRLDDAAHVLHAQVDMDYINHSPDTLREIFFHLWPNAYKGKKSALAKNLARDGNFILYTAAQKYRGGIDSLSFSVNGEKADWSFYGEYVDVAVIRLKNPLLPGQSIAIATPFRVKIPSGSISRLGHIGESYQITQWYPKPAVYDHNGWHAMPYLNQGEFYSEFGSFDVSITLPENYTIGATGDCQTLSELDRMDKLAKVTDIPPAKNEFPKSSNTFKTVRYTQKNVHDFGWFADKRWLVRKGFCVLPNSGDTVTTWALFTPENATIWEGTGLKAIRDGLYYYSLWSGDYPYKQCTAVDGTISAGGGMEYPNVTVIGSTDSKSGLATVIVHEVGHNWFYGILGSNERDNAWMDEGLNSFFETRTMMAIKDTTMMVEMVAGGIPLGSKLGLDKLSYQYLSEELIYLISARYGNDQPMQLTSEAYTDLNYGGIVYKKTSLVFNYLMQYLGEDTFNKCMAEYYNQWKFKHPEPRDLQNTFEKCSGKNLNWLFKDIIQTSYRVDFAARRVKRKGDQFSVKVANRGDAEGPFGVRVERNGTVVHNQWYDPIKPLSSRTVTVPAQRGDVVRVNAENGLPEFNRHNDYTRTAGIFRRVEPLKLGFLTNLDKPGETRVNWLPIMGWNDYDHWMLGLNLHNKVVPRKKIEWSVAPMYSLANNSINGFAQINYHGRILSGGLRGRTFGLEDRIPFGFEQIPLTFFDYRWINQRYAVVNPYIEVDLAPSRRSRKLNLKLRADLFMIYFQSDKDENTKWTQSSISRLRATFSKVWTVDEISLRSDIILGDPNQALGNLNAVSYKRVVFPAKKKKLHVNAFFSPGWDAFVPKGLSGQTGAQDITYEGLYFGRLRNEGLLARQINSSNGGLLAPTGLFTRGTMASLSAELDLPIRLPIGVYGSIVYAQEVREDVREWIQPRVEDTQFWSAGVTIPIARGTCQFWLPIVYSSAVQDHISKARLGFFETFMFELNIDLMNPFGLPANLGR